MTPQEATQMSNQLANQTQPLNPSQGQPALNSIEAKKQAIFDQMKHIEETRGITSDRAPEPKTENKSEQTVKTGETADKKIVVDNLLDAIEMESNKNPNEWHWGEGVKGDGKKPDWMRKEFKSAEDQAKAYNALVKKFGDFSGAPENYDFSSVENSEFHVHPEANNSKEFVKIAKEMGLSQEGFQKIMTFFNKNVAPTFKGQGQAPIDSQAEIAKLGEGGKEKVKVLDQWLQNNYPENYGTFRKMLKTADDIKAFLSLRQNIVSSEDNTGSLNFSPKPYSQRTAHENVKSELAAAIKSGDSAAKERAMSKYREVFSN